MSEGSAPRRGVDVSALTLAVVGLFLSFSLLAASGAERFAAPSERAMATIPGHLRFHLFEALGLAAYMLIAGWGLVVVLRVRRASWPRICRHIVGLALLTLGCAIGLDRSPREIDGPAIGLGGALGAAGSLWLEQQFPQPIGATLLAFTLAAGLCLAAEPVTRAAWIGARRAAWLAALAFEWLVSRLADLLEALGKSIRALIRPLSRRLRPDRFPLVLELVEEPKREPTALIPIHHHAAPAITPPSIIPFVPKMPKVEAPAEERPYDLPSLELLEEPVVVRVENQDEKLMAVASQLEKACADFGLIVKVVGINTGPVITQYEISLDTGLRVSKITALSDDLALHLKVPSVRVIAPIPGKNTVGVEVPNEQRAVVRMKELATTGHAKIAKSKLPLLLGKDTEGRALVYDLADMPHLLIAGRTGTGKSVCLNSIILSLLLTRRPDECKLIMIDPKQVELAEYGRLPHLMHPVVTDNKKAEAILAWAVDKMEERYEILRRSRVRNIAGYNDLPYEEILRRVKPVDEDEQKRVPPRMPYIVIVVDEVGDLMMAMKKEVEGHIIRLAQKSRAAGIHLILTTQRPTVDVITGLIKSNLPARICFQVADRSNSRVVLDEMGAEKLLGKGDMLFLQPNTSQIVRAQGAFASDDEILRVVGKLEVENPTYDHELLGLEGRESPGKGGMMEAIRKRDDLYEEAIEVVIREGRGSVSLLQRALGIGYGRAARLVDYMAEDGIVGGFNGGQAREVLFTLEQWDQMKSGGDRLAESA
jgi:S-DNA-T family DNA segregation ATPase FtsK/SpoIIIE